MLSINIRSVVERCKSISTGTTSVVVLAPGVSDGERTELVAQLGAEGASPASVIVAKPLAAVSHVQRALQHL